MVSGLMISDEIVHLDDKHFIECTLTGCQLMYNGGPVIFERTTLLRCRHIFYGPARATVRYLQEVGFLESEFGKWFDSVEAVN